MMVPAEALAKLTSTVVEYVLVAVAQSPAVVVAVKLQTGVGGVTDQAVRAATAEVMVEQPARLTVAV